MIPASLTQQDPHYEIYIKERQLKKGIYLISYIETFLILLAAALP